MRPRSVSFQRPQLLIWNFHGVGAPHTGVGSAERDVWLDETDFECALNFAAHAGPGQITFDDGNESDWSIALPKLLSRGLTATFFVCAGRIGSPAYLSVSHLRQLVSAGMTIGSHGWSHRSWRGLSEAEAKVEWQDARRAIQDASGQDVTDAACPFGEYDGRVLAGLRGSGFRRVFTSDRALASPSAFVRPRFTVRRCDRPGSIAAVRDRSVWWHRATRTRLALKRIR